MKHLTQTEHTSQILSKLSKANHAFEKQYLGVGNPFPIELRATESSIYRVPMVL